MRTAFAVAEAAKWAVFVGQVQLPARILLLDVESVAMAAEEELAAAHGDAEGELPGVAVEVGVVEVAPPEAAEAA